jgi:hypothetical protein
MRLAAINEGVMLFHTWNHAVTRQDFGHQLSPVAEQVGNVSMLMQRMLPLLPSLEIEVLALHKLPTEKLRSQEEERLYLY